MKSQLLNLVISNIKFNFDVVKETKLNTASDYYVDDSIHYDNILTIKSNNNVIDIVVTVIDFDDDMVVVVYPSDKIPNCDYDYFDEIMSNIIANIKQRNKNIIYEGATETHLRIEYMN